MLRNNRNEEGCDYCEKHPDILNKKEGYAVLWPEVKKEFDKLVRQGVNRDLAMTTAVNKFIVWVKGSKICKMKSRELVLKKFWEFYRSAPAELDIQGKQEHAISAVDKYFRKKYPGAYECFMNDEKYKYTGGGK